MCARQLCQASGSVWLKITADTTVFAPRKRSAVIIRGGLEARNKCPCVIDYTLQANEINRAWIDWVEITPEGQTSPRATRALTRWCSERRWRRSTLQFFLFSLAASRDALVLSLPRPPPTISFGHRWPWLRQQAAASRIWQALYLTISTKRKNPLARRKASSTSAVKRPAVSGNDVGKTQNKTKQKTPRQGCDENRLISER